MIEELTLADSLARAQCSHPRWSTFRFQHQADEFRNAYRALGINEVLEVFVLDVAKVAISEHGQIIRKNSSAKRKGRGFADAWIGVGKEQSKALKGLFFPWKLTCGAVCWLMCSTFFGNIESFQTFGGNFESGQYGQRGGNLCPIETGIRGRRCGGEVFLENSFRRGGFSG